MKATLRKKKISNGKESLYIDIYAPELGRKRFKEYLKLYVITKPVSKTDRKVNKETYDLAENIRAKRLIELQNETHGFMYKDRRKINFIEYFAEQTEKRKESKSGYANWYSVHKHLIKFAGEKVPFSEINSEWLERFKKYLTNEALSRGNESLSKNSCHMYFNRVRECLRQAVKDKIINFNPAMEVSGLKKVETQREYLTLEELKKMANTECKKSIIKKAFLFSALTGLRWSDIYKLTWKEIQRSDENGWYIRFTQQKTDGVETLPISMQARKLLGKEDDAEEKVFNDLTYSAHIKIILLDWINKAGINKEITFHCARHTYATMQLTLGTDIYTVSKLLGHKELKTTQVYAKIIDQKKVDAANRIPDLKI